MPSRRRGLYNDIPLLLIEESGRTDKEREAIERAKITVDNARLTVLRYAIDKDDLRNLLDECGLLTYDLFLKKAPSVAYTDNARGLAR